MQGSKIRLSDAERELFPNADIILTKNSILQKTFLLLEEVQETLLKENYDMDSRFSCSPKISKGENYLGLPYVVLDYPREAKDQNIFFIRSMFWWGNFFSSTLHLSGNFTEEYRLKLEGAYDTLSGNDYFIGISKDPWQHHFGGDNYRKINALTKEAFAVILEESQHIKIAASWPLQEWDEAANKLIESWKLLLALVA